MKTILSIDPGRSKCGFAVVRRRSDGGAQVLEKGVVDTGVVRDTVRELGSRFEPAAIVIGDGTTSSNLARALAELDIAPVEFVDEKFTTALARKRYFKENPPRGLRRLIPTSLQTPRRPCDDYVAVILAEKYLGSVQVV